MASRFVYHQKIKDSWWPHGFRILGAALYGTADVLPSAERIEAFEAGLMSGDEVGDRAARELFLSERSHRQSYALLQKAIENVDRVDETIPDFLRELLVGVANDPDWLDRAQLERGAAVCRRLGGHAMTVLGDFALCGGYANADITKPLVFSGALNGERTFDRVSETSQFWVDVTRRNALLPGGSGFKSALKVRMMHAVMRQRLLQHPQWDSDAWGWPINASDSLATNVGFSMGMIYGCKMLGFRIDNDEIADVLHLWRYIGFLMGDDCEWLPKNAAEGLQSLLLILLSNPNEPDEDSRRLAIDYLMNFQPKSNGLPAIDYARQYFQFLKHKAYAEYLIPPDLYRKLRPPTSRGSWLLIPLVEVPAIFALDRVRALLPPLGRWAESKGGREQEFIVSDRMGARKASFQTTEQMAR